MVAKVQKYLAHDSLFVLRTANPPLCIFNLCIFTHKNYP